MLVLGTLYWGISFPIIKTISVLNHDLVPGAGTWFLSAATVAPRYTLAALIVLILNWGRGWPNRSELMQGIKMGLFAAGGTLLQTDGLQSTSASTSAFLTQLSAVLIPAYLALRSRKGPSATVWWACALVMAGAAILCHVSWSQLRLGKGEWETVVCSAFFAGQILALDEKKYAGNRAAMVTLSMFSVESAVFLVLCAFTAPTPGALVAPWTSGPWLGLTLILTVVCTVGAFSLMNIWQPKIASTEAGLIYCIEPLFTALFALFLPGLISSWTGIRYANEMVTWSLFAGGGLITIANVMVLTQSREVA